VRNFNSNQNIAHQALDGCVGRWPRRGAVQAVDPIVAVVDWIEAEFNTARARLAVWASTT